MHGVIIIDNTTFDENVAEKHRGSLYAAHGTAYQITLKDTHLVINNSTFTNNLHKKMVVEYI